MRRLLRWKQAAAAEHGVAFDALNLAPGDDLPQTLYGPVRPAREEPVDGGTAPCV
jgi:hypothetical protein